MKLWFKQLLCRHAWIKICENKYDIVNSAGHKAGRVTLAHLNCKRCGKETLAVTDRKP